MAGHTTELTKGKLHNIAAKLRKVPKAERPEHAVSKLDGVRTLIKEIAALRQRGYTLAEIAEILSNEGMRISTTVLRTYVNRVAHEGAPAPSRAVRKKRLDTPARPPAAAGKGSFAPRPDSEDI